MEGGWWDWDEDEEDVDRPEKQAVEGGKEVESEEWVIEARGEWWKKSRDNGDRDTCGITLHLLSEKRRKEENNSQRRGEGGAKK